MDVQSNLYLRCNARVNRVLFDGNNKAVSVAYVPSRNRASNGQVVETIVKARKMVMLSSGTLGTPQVSEPSASVCHGRHELSLLLCRFLSALVSVTPSS